VATRRDDTGPGDREWVEALQRGEGWAWEQLHGRTLERVYAYVHRHTSRREDAEDITAEVFAAAVASIHQFRGDASVLTWLIGIARRKLIDAARRRRRQPEVLETDLPAPAADTAAGMRLSETAGGESPAEAVERLETSAQVRRLLLLLPEAQRQALWLRCADQLSVAETARVLGRSENAVKALLRRAKEALQQQISPGTGSSDTDSIRQERDHEEPLQFTALPAAPRPRRD
jgi:RNA polymerase sigma factor (sigma-70 family)